MQPNSSLPREFGNVFPGDVARRPAATRPSTNNNNNNDTNNAKLLTNSLQRLSLHTATNTPLPQSPRLNSPRRVPDLHRLPSSPRLSSASTSDSNPLRRSSSVASLSRSSSPALIRKSSTSSLRGDMPSTPRATPSRRPSFNPNANTSMPSPVVAKSPLNPHFEEKLPLRACDVAEEYFKKELALHEGIAGSVTAGTIVIIHDQCYGHRFSRQKTPKAVLGQIVERPERMLAIVRGVATAYVRLGDRHSEGRHPPHPHHNPPGRIPFKIRTTQRSVDLNSAAVTNVHGTKWMEELKTMCIKAEQKLATTGKELAREGPRIPGQPPKPEFHETDLYLCSESLNALQGALGGVLDAVDSVFTGTSLGTGPSRAFVCVRPPGHHCSSDYPSGFCWLNNVHVGIEHAIMQHGLTHAAIIDFDLHHGDGSQSITWERNKKVQKMHRNTAQSKKTSIGYFSLHDINSYPCEYGDDEKVQAASLCIDNAHGQSIWNVHLEAWKTKEEFWKLYEGKYMVLLDKTRLYLRHHTKRLQALSNGPIPKAAIFISAGFDASEHEGAGMQRHVVNVPTDFYARFTRDIVRLAEEEGTGADGRVISVLEGGYSDRALTSGALSHISGLTDGQIFPDRTASPSLGSDMRQRFSGLGTISGLAMKQEDVEGSESMLTSDSTPVEYDSHWWHESNLAELENLVNPPPLVPKKPARTGPPPNFSSPTQSFVAKVVDPTKVYRSMSSRFSSASPSRAPTPPPPEVDWATAAHSLSNLLIPSDRQTTSHKPEDLAEVKVKKEKPQPQPQPAMASVHVDRSGRQLRGRKPILSPADPDQGAPSVSLRPESRSDRRKTIADFSIPSEPPVTARSASRRMSIASSVGSVKEERSVSRASSVLPVRKRVTPVPPVPPLPTNGVQLKKTRGSVPARTSSSAADDDLSLLTAGLSRVKLTLPATEEEYNARRKAKEEEKKTAVKPVLKKAPAPRATKTIAKVTTTTTKPAPTATKKAPGRIPRSSKSATTTDIGPAASSVKNLIPKSEPASVPEEPRFQHAASPPLKQPQPVIPEQTATLPQELPRSLSIGTIDPPTELTNMTITPEQLPRPTVIETAEVIPVVQSPPRPDTPPPPPPAVMSEFVNYNTHTFGTTSVLGENKNRVGVNEQEPQAPLRWMTPATNVAPPSAMLPTSNSLSHPMSPLGNPPPGFDMVRDISVSQSHLPVFTSNGTIPFASNPNVSAQQAGNQRPLDDKKNKVKLGGDIWEVPETPQ